MTGKKLLVQVVVEGEKGGAGSGNFGHSGRPGKLGGSIPKGAGGSSGPGIVLDNQAITRKPGDTVTLPSGATAIVSKVVDNKRVMVESVAAPSARSNLANKFDGQVSADGSVAILGNKTSAVSNFLQGKGYTELSRKGEGQHQEIIMHNQRTGDYAKIDTGSGGGQAYTYAKFSKDKPSLSAKPTLESRVGGSAQPLSKGYSIKWEGLPGYHMLSGFTDKKIEASLSKLEKRAGKKLERDSRTDFPSFTVYHNGEEIGGG